MPTLVRTCSNRLVQYRLPLALLLAPALLLTLACESDSLKPKLADPSGLYWDVELNHGAVTIGTTPPYDTLTLIATPRNALGEPMLGPAAQFISKNGERIGVTADGVLHGMRETTVNEWVVATISIDNVKHSDSVLVRVVNTATAPPPVLASLSVHPIPPDSAKASVVNDNSATTFLRPVLPVTALDINGAPIAGLPVTFHSSNTTVAKVGAASGVITGVSLGETTIYATTSAFGVTKADTLPYRIGLPVRYDVSVNAFAGSTSIAYSVMPSEIKVGLGAVVFFRLPTGIPNALFPATTDIDITFADADLPYIAAANTFPYQEAAGIGSVGNACNDPFPFLFPSTDCSLAGNITLTTAPPSIPFTTRSIALRVFTRVGTYEYRSVLHGLSGRIVVVGETP